MLPLIAGSCRTFLLQCLQVSRLGCCFKMRARFAVVITLPEIIMEVANHGKALVCKGKW